MKNDNYNERTEIVLTKHDDTFYTLNYIAPDDERYALSMATLKSQLNVITY